MDYAIPIVVIAYNRPKALERLLSSLLKADYPGPVELILSIDREEEKRGRGEEVRRIAIDFEWPFGEKKLIIHEENLGLRKHVLACGDLSRDYDAVIVLEDDLYVSPEFYIFTLQAFEFFRDDTGVAGISLYSHAYNETAQFPFVPLNDGTDVFFFQYAASWGQCWSRQQWSKFRRWYDEAGSRGITKYLLPPNIQLWPETSWKKYFIEYLIRNDLYFVYPRMSLTTVFGDEGTNIRLQETFLQVPLLSGERNFVFQKLQDSNAVYDTWCEILPDRLRKIWQVAPNGAFNVDLYGMKSKTSSRSDMLISSRHCHTPVKTYGREMKPHEENLINNVPGDYFSFGRNEDFNDPPYLVRLLNCHQKRELSYWYPIREYHFAGNKLLTTHRTRRPYFDLAFIVKKFTVMFSYAFRYFRKGS